MPDVQRLLVLPFAYVRIRPLVFAYVRLRSRVCLKSASEKDARRAVSAGAPVRLLSHTFACVRACASRVQVKGMPDVRRAAVSI